MRNVQWHHVYRFACHVACWEETSSSEFDVKLNFDNSIRHVLRVTSSWTSHRKYSWGPQRSTRKWNQSERKKNALVAKASTEKVVSAKEETWRWHWIKLCLIYEFMFFVAKRAARRTEPENKWMFTETWEQKKVANTLHLNYLRPSIQFCDEPCWSKAFAIAPGGFSYEMISAPTALPSGGDEMQAISGIRAIFIRKFNRLERSMNRVRVNKYR